MIRARRDEDLEVLVAVLRSSSHPPTAPDGLEGWLTEHDPLQSWVYDMAPMHVTPTRNVVGHVQLCQPDDALATLVHDRTGTPVGQQVAVEKLFVRPDRHEAGFARQLLKAAIDQVTELGKVPVVDLGENPSLTVEACTRRGLKVVSEGTTTVLTGARTGSRGAGPAPE
ncbi:GNAT family N-acetyltransferase [Nocardioides caldifontis]|uniref:GNAT family N-acetyltransferase n=1 Tax=Nocardioides caldifontis TaxID=2588938 RepID=UPI0011DF30F5|nr:GNAT family N-acetyltransferase [Nocardioides caldifontis]